MQKLVMMEARRWKERERKTLKKPPMGKHLMCGPESKTDVT